MDEEKEEQEVQEKTEGETEKVPEKEIDLDAE